MPPDPMKKPELLLPAGDPVGLRTAVHYGADAVYLGGDAFSLRAAAGNFSCAQMDEGIRYAHANGCRVYVTANIFAHDSDLAQAGPFFDTLSHLSPDAVLISDPGMFRLSRRYCPDVPIHISTQANNVNSETFLFWYDMGVRRLVCGRELSLSEIRTIRANIPADMEIEAFVHGAMCISYSGRCLMSNYMAGRDANRGACTHPCRWEYTVMEEKRPGEYFPVSETEHGTFLFSSKDLCMIGHLPDLIEAGIDSFKIEGRMKSPLYTALMARTYRLALDTCLEDPDAYAAQIPVYETQVRACTHRDYCTGFFYGTPDGSSLLYDRKAYEQSYVYLGVIDEISSEGRIFLTQKNKFSVGEIIEIMRPDGADLAVRVSDLRDAQGQLIESAPHPKMAVSFLPEPLDGTSGCAMSVGDVIRRKL